MPLRPERCLSLQIEWRWRSSPLCIASLAPTVCSVYRAGLDDPLAGEVKDRGELVKVMVVVKDSEAALCGCCRDERVGNAYAMCARGTAASQILHGTDRGVCHRAIEWSLSQVGHCGRDSIDMVAVRCVVKELQCDDWASDEFASKCGCLPLGTTAGLDARAQADVSATHGPSRQLSATRDLGRCATGEGQVRRCRGPHLSGSHDRDRLRRHHCWRPWARRHWSSCDRSDWLNPHALHSPRVRVRRPRAAAQSLACPVASRSSRVGAPWWSCPGF